MRSAAEWFDRLRAAAPGLDPTFLRILARILSCDTLTAEAFFVVADALEEAAREASAGGAESLPLFNLCAVVRRAAGHAPRIGAFW